MLRLQNIVKIYDTGATKVEALRGIDIAFRRSEFVAVLGPSGCGKTTLLNIIGGLDRYTSGDLAIRGKSTKHFTDKEWDTYRNHSVGFVFQTYNLIPHQTVLANVELALTLSGVSKAERRKRAVDALTQVGLADQLYKKPNQLSGGQMQRVAIARALVNNPDIVLADEPTGALDSETSTQVMDILKRVSEDRLVIMVTHNAELAEKYATRIVRLMDGRIISDSNPYDGTDQAGPARNADPLTAAQRPSMSFATALSLSFNNLLTKKARTLLTAFAGSIGIIGIALILSLSSGFQDYISTVEAETLASYPITIEEQAVDAQAAMQAVRNIQRTRQGPREEEAVYVNAELVNRLNFRAAQIHQNDLARFKAYIEAHYDELAPHLTALSYGYDIPFTVYAVGTPAGTVQVHPSPLVDAFSSMMELNPNRWAIMTMSGLVAWQELLDNPEFLAAQYDVVAGRWPSAYNEVVLIVDDRGEISDLTLFGLGLADPEEAVRVLRSGGENVRLELPRYSISYDEILDLRFKLVLPPDRYAYDEELGVWVERTGDLEDMLAGAVELRIAGIVRPAEGSVTGTNQSLIGYTPALTRYIIDAVREAPIVVAQLENPAVNVFSGRPFGEATQTAAAAEAAPFPVAPGMGPAGGFDELTPEQRAFLANLTPEQLAQLFSRFPQAGQTVPVPVPVPADTYEEVTALLGVVDPDRPATISLYAKDFEARDYVTDFIAEYNRKQTEAGEGQYTIAYTDIIRMMISSVTTIINSISYVLIAFVAISLVVSSIMIGIITYISVLERTKEIGILRSIGASKRDIGRVFNAETLIIGFAAGALGVGVTVLLCVPINMVIESLTGIPNVAGLPARAGAVLIAISMVLTLIAGLIPARIAAKKDPVVALRTE